MGLEVKDIKQFVGEGKKNHDLKTGVGEFQVIS